MKKLLLVVASAIFSLNATAQTDTAKKHVGYLSAGFNYSPRSSNSLSIEGGTWGITSNTTFGVTYDIVPISIGGKNYYSQWAGVKAYWTTHSETKLCYMVYVALKTCINSKQGMEHELIEFGFNPYYTISKHTLFGVCIGDQYYGSDNSWNIFLNCGFTFLFN